MSASAGDPIWNRRRRPGYFPPGSGHFQSMRRWCAWRLAICRNGLHWKETVPHPARFILHRSMRDSMYFQRARPDKIDFMKDKNQRSFLVGTTEMAQRMRTHDWSTSSLDPPQLWPQSLRSVVHLMLGSAFPMFVVWGPNLALLYNDSYAEVLGDKHPAALGMPFYKVWHEAQDDLVPLVQRALGGESFYMENLPLRLRRHGFDDDAWFTFSYSPVLDDEGTTAGIYCACIETTAMVRAEQQQRVQQQRLQALFRQTPGFTAVLRGPDHVFEIANQSYLQPTGFREVLGKPCRK